MLMPEVADSRNLAAEAFLKYVQYCSTASEWEWSAMVGFFLLAEFTLGFSHDVWE
jgi:hypothetical protein